MFLSAAMMLDWLADRHAEPRLAAWASTIERAVEAVLSGGRHVPMEHGGATGTAGMTQAVIDALPAAALAGAA